MCTINVAIYLCPSHTREANLYPSTHSFLYTFTFPTGTLSKTPGLKYQWPQFPLLLLYYNTTVSHNLCPRFNTIPVPSIRLWQSPVLLSPLAVPNCWVTQETECSLHYLGCEKHSKLINHREAFKLKDEKTVQSLFIFWSAPYIILCDF